MSISCISILHFASDNQPVNDSCSQNIVPSQVMWAPRGRFEGAVARESKETLCSNGGGGGGGGTAARESQGGQKDIVQQN